MLIIVLAVVVGGLAYLISGLSGVPELTQFEVTGELARTEYRASEEITVEPFITYYGMRPVTIRSGVPLLYLFVYTAGDERVLQVPPMAIVGADHTLTPNVPYNEKDRWHEFSSYLHDAEYLKLYTFTLEQAGSYYVVVEAAFGLGEEGSLLNSRVHSEPIWLQIVD